MSTAIVEQPANDQVPATAQGFHKWQLDAWGGQMHPAWLSFEVVRGKFGVYDGYVDGQDALASMYLLGWLEGRLSKPGR